MLSKPFAGWTTITYEDFSEDISYLDDIPLDWTKAFEIYLEHIVKNDLVNIVPLSIIGDCEGYDLIIIATNYMLKMFTCEKSLETFNTNVFEFIQRICLDFIKDINEWTKWQVFDFECLDDGSLTQDSIDAMNKRKEEILGNIDRIRKLIHEISNHAYYQWIDVIL